MRRITLPHLLVCGLILGLFFAPYTVTGPVPLLEYLELKTIDFRFALRGKRAATEKIVIAGIEKKSIETFGRWPWPRSVFAQLIVQLKDMGAETILFDLLFSEPESVSEVALLSGLQKDYEDLGLLTDAFESQIFMDELKQALATSDTDTLMADAVAMAGNVILGLALEAGTDCRNELRRPPAGSCYDETAGRKKAPRPGSCLLGPIPELSQHAAGFGFVNVFPDRDGVVRRIRPFLDYGRYAVMPLAVAGMSHYSGLRPSLKRDGMIVGQVHIPAEDELILDFLGGEDSFKAYAISDIIAGALPPDAVKGKIVLIGGLATGLSDIWPTPISSETPGVFVQATLLENLIENRIIRQWQCPVSLQLAGIFLGVVSLLVLTCFLPPMFSLLIGVSGMILYLVVSQYLFTANLLLIPLVYPLALCTVTLSGLVMVNLVQETRRHQWIKTSFSRYLSQDVIDLLVKKPDQLSLGGEERELTVIMADIRGFTTLSEGLAPKQLTTLLNLYLGVLTDIILDHGGTLDKYMGDAVMAFFGAPVAHPEDPVTACRAAVSMCEALHEKRLEWEAQGLPKLQIGVGVNTGPMVVGNLGSARRFDYSVIGDHVNLASRLEGLSKVYGVKIIISEYSKAYLAGRMVTRELDQVRVKGRSQPVRIFELLGKDYVTGGAYTFVETFEKGLQAYRAKRFLKAAGHFETTLDLKPGDNPSRLFLKRCRTLASEPPEADWDGTWSFTQK